MSTPTTTLFDRYKRDQTLVDEGAWIELFPGASFRIRSEQSKAVRTYDNEQVQKNRPLINSGELSKRPDLVDELEIKKAAEILVSDWKGEAITDAQGKPLPFSVENAIWLFTELPDVRDLVFSISRSLEAYRAKAQKAVEGNSSASSAPASNTESTPTP